MKNKLIEKIEFLFVRFFFDLAKIIPESSLRKFLRSLFKLFFF